MNRIWLIERIMFATILGANLFIESKRYKIDFIANESDIGLITSDQPVINLNSQKDNDVCLYYPLSQNLAMRLSTNENVENNSGCVVGALAAEFYNYSMYRACYDQFYGAKGSYLEKLAQLPRDFVS